MKTKKEILDFVLNAGSDSVEVFGGNFKGGYELQQCPEEITEFLNAYQNTEIDNFLEIGVAAGGNTRIFTDFLKIKDVHVMDLNVHPSISYDGNPNARDNNFNHLKNSGELKSFFGDSNSEDARKWLESLNIKLQMVFLETIISSLCILWSFILSDFTGLNVPAPTCNTKYSVDI